MQQQSILLHKIFKKVVQPSNIRGWSDEGLVMEEVSMVDGIQTVRVVDTMPASSENPRRFIRLRVQEKAVPVGL